MLLTTGITGHSGGHFLRELIARHHGGPLRCLVRPASNTAQLDASGLQVEKVVGSLADEAWLDRAMEGVTTVLHIASIRHSPSIVRAALKQGVKRVIVVHTSGVFSKYRNAAGEYLEIEAGLRRTLAEARPAPGLVILRPTMIYGSLRDNNMAVFIRMIDRLRICPVIDGGRHRLQPVHARDLGKAYYQLVCKPELLNGEYTLSGERPVTMREMLALISAYLGKQTVFVPVPLGGGVLLARALRALSAGRFDYVERIQRMGEDRSYPHSAASADFGYAPMSFAEGLRGEVNEYLGRRPC